MSKRCSRASTDGFSVLELIVALGISLGVAAGVLALAVAGRNLYRTDEVRTRMNQNLRSTRDLLVADVLGAGERLAPDFPAILIVDGTSGGPDRLTLRRNLSDAVLPVCKEVSGSDPKVRIATKSTPPPGCDVLDDTDSDGWPDNLDSWRDHRLANGGNVIAYIFNPVTDEGEFFEYDQEDEDSKDFIVSAASGTSWTYVYPPDEQCRVYLIEERRYEMNGDLLQLVLDDDTVAPLNVVYGLTDFQATATMQDGTTQTSLTAADDWTSLAALTLELQAGETLRERTMKERLVSEVFPRNVLSD